MPELVSAVITTHNRIDLLPRAIASVQAQTYPAIELIVVDDASTDGTEALCTGQDYTYLRIPPGESCGGNHARNLGIRAAHGTYVAFLDDDDYWLPGKIARQVALLERTDAALVHCGRRLELVQEDGSVTFHDTVPGEETRGDMHARILYMFCNTSSCLLLRRQTLLAIGLFDESLQFWQDYELTIRLAQQAPFDYVNEPLMVYRVDRKDKGRLTNKYAAWKQAVRQIYEKHRALYAALGPIEALRYRLLVLDDAAGRLASCGHPWRARLLHRLAFLGSLTYRIPRKLRKIWKAARGG